MKTKPEVEDLKRTLKVFPALGYVFLVESYGLRIVRLGRIYSCSDLYRINNRGLLLRRGLSSFSRQLEADYGKKHQEALERVPARELLSVSFGIFDHRWEQHRTLAAFWLQDKHGLSIQYFTHRGADFHFIKDIYEHLPRRIRQMWLRLISSLEHLPLYLRVK